MAESLQNLKSMLTNLDDASRRIVLGMNTDKTKIMFNDLIDPEPTAINGVLLDVYLGQILQLGKNNFEKEANRRIQLGWAAFGPTPTPNPLQPQPQGLIVETSNGASVLQLPASTLEQIRHIAGDPGASTLRLPPPAAEPPAGARELDFDLCYVCKHCKVAFPAPAPLQAHQARACYAGREAARGLIRVVQPALECRACVGERFRTVAEFRRHADGEAHARSAAPALPAPPEPLTHEMEDVVNQITLLAARAAQDASPAADNANYCSGSARFLPPGELPLASAGH